MNKFSKNKLAFVSSVSLVFFVVSCAFNKELSNQTRNVDNKIEARLRVLDKRIDRSGRQEEQILDSIVQKTNEVAKTQQENFKDLAQINKKLNEHFDSLSFTKGILATDYFFNFDSLKEYRQPYQRYLYTLEKNKQLKQELKRLDKQQEKAIAYQEALLKLKSLFKDAFLIYQKLLSYLEQSLVLEKQVEMSTEALKSAQYNNWSIPKEIALYVFGFKWLWGLASLYSPTRSYSKELEAQQDSLFKLQEVFRTLEAEKPKLQEKLKNKLSLFFAQLEKVKGLTSETSELNSLLALEMVTIRFFEEDLEVFRDYLMNEWRRLRFTARSGVRRIDYEKNRWLYTLSGFSWSPLKSSASSAVNFYQEQVQPHLAYRDLLAFQTKKSYWWNWGDNLTQGLPTSVLPPLWNVWTSEPLKAHYEFDTFKSAEGAFNWKRITPQEQTFITHLSWEESPSYFDVLDVPTGLIEGLLSSPVQKLTEIEFLKQQVKEVLAKNQEFLDKVKLVDKNREIQAAFNLQHVNLLLEDSVNLRVLLSEKLLQSEKEETNSSSLLTKGINSFINLLNLALKKVVESEVSFKELLVLEEQAKIAEELVFLKEKDLKLGELANWGIASEVVLYLFGFKWLWGAFTGYQSTPLVSREKEELENAKEILLASQEKLATKQQTLQTKFETAFNSAIQTLQEAGKLSVSNKPEIEKFITAFSDVFSQYKHAKSEYEAARKVFSKYRETSLEPFSEANAIDSYFSVPGLITHLMSAGVLGQESRQEEQQKILDNIMSDTKHQVVEFRIAVEKFNLAQKNFEEFFSPEGRVKLLFTILEKEYKLQEQKETLREFIEFTLAIENRLKQEVNALENIQGDEELQKLLNRQFLEKFVLEEEN